MSSICFVVYITTSLWIPLIIAFIPQYLPYTSLTYMIVITSPPDVLVIPQQWRSSFPPYYVHTFPWRRMSMQYEEDAQGRKTLKLQKGESYRVNKPVEIPMTGRQSPCIWKLNSEL